MKTVTLSLSMVTMVSSLSWASESKPESISSLSVERENGSTIHYYLDKSKPDSEALLVIAQALIATVFAKILASITNFPNSFQMPMYSPWRSMVSTNHLSGMQIPIGRTVLPNTYKMTPQTNVFKTMFRCSTH
ncbi:hypothetical protein [Vibrio mexicanus]|uniref:hypothetical protein n=1 Tax=Vibrio mexicanus TaxID=1004326 RepID=UPI00069C7140|nr:hypothetical protein [Vibrio mexicanus]